MASSKIYDEIFDPEVPKDEKFNQLLLIRIKETKFETEKREKKGTSNRRRKTTDRQQ